MRCGKRGRSVVLKRLLLAARSRRGTPGTLCNSSRASPVSDALSCRFRTRGWRSPGATLRPIITSVVSFTRRASGLEPLDSPTSRRTRSPSVSDHPLDRESACPGLPRASRTGAREPRTPPTSPCLDTHANASSAPKTGSLGDLNRTSTTPPRQLGRWILLAIAAIALLLGCLRLGPLRASRY
jgi:hypothetical protein